MPLLVRLVQSRHEEVQRANQRQNRAKDEQEQILPNSKIVSLRYVFRLQKMEQMGEMK